MCMYIHIYVYHISLSLHIDSTSVDCKQCEFFAIICRPTKLLKLKTTGDGEPDSVQTPKVKNLNMPQAKALSNRGLP